MRKLSHSRPGREWQGLDLGNGWLRAIGGRQHFLSVSTRFGTLIERNERPGCGKSAFFGVPTRRWPAGLRIQHTRATWMQPCIHIHPHTITSPARSPSFIHLQEKREECALPLRYFCARRGACQSSSFSGDHPLTRHDTTSNESCTFHVGTCGTHFEWFLFNLEPQLFIMTSHRSQCIRVILRGALIL